MALRIKSIKIPLFSLVLVAAVGLIGISLYSTWLVKQNALDAKLALVKEHAQSARTIVDAFHAKAVKGEMTDDEAKTAAANVLRTMKWGSSGYIFVYDFTATSIVHGGIPSREGKTCPIPPTARF